MEDDYLREQIGPVPSSDPDLSPPQSQPRETICQKVTKIWKNVSVEPTIFMLTFSYALYSIIAQVRRNNIY